MTDLIAGLALVVSVVALASQGVGAFRRRRHLVLRAYSGSMTGIVNGVPSSISIVTVRAQAIGGPIGIGDIDFEWNPKPKGNSGWMDASPIPGRPSMNLFDSHPALQEGETAVWTYSFNAGDDPGDVDAVYQVRAVATRLHSRKKVFSGPVFIWPSVPQGLPDSHRVSEQHKAWAAANVSWADEGELKLLSWWKRLWRRITRTLNH